MTISGTLIGPRKKILEIIWNHSLAGEYLSLDGLYRILRRQGQMVAAGLVASRRRDYKALLLLASVYYTQNPKSQYYIESRSLV